jgi:flagellin
LRFFFKERNVSFYINTNIASLNAQMYLQQTSASQQQTIAQVTSGLRIVSSGDDAAGLAIANGYRSNEAVLTQGILNANNGLSQLQIVDGGMSNISQLLDQARTLATESASGTFSGDRTVLNQQFQGIIQEINRQAQAIGLNTGGEFAQNLSVFIGGGTAFGSTTAVQNGSISINLTSATVDAKSLGLQGVQAIGVAGTDIGTGSANSSVSSIINNGANTATEAQAGYTVFNFYGPGFSNLSGSGKVSVSVNLNGVTDANSLVTAINAAIQAEGNAGSQQATAFKNAGIVAGLNVDSSGKTQLTFSSSTSAFQVQAGDAVSNALMGNLQSGTSTSAGAATTGAAAVTANGATAETGVTLTIDGHTTGAFNIAANATVSQILTDVQTAISGTSALAGYSASLNASGQLVITSPNVTAPTVTATGDTGNLLGVSSTTAGVVNNSFNSQGANQSVTSANSDVYSFTAVGAGNTQTIGITALDSTGGAHALTVNLTSTNAGSLGAAVTAINTALQQSNDPTLQSMVAVEQVNNAGTAVGIRFLSSAATFKINIGAAPSNQGLYDNSTGSPVQGEVESSAVYGTGSTASIGNITSAQNAVAALGTSVTLLGRAQAAVGQGENELNYASNLAQSQLTNFSAAEARIRDADLAQASANLTKEQIQLQAGVAALAQANSAPQAILALLKG